MVYFAPCGKKLKSVPEVARVSPTFLGGEFMYNRKITCCYDIIIHEKGDHSNTCALNIYFSVGWQFLHKFHGICWTYSSLLSTIYISVP